MAKLKFKRLNPAARDPIYATEGAAGMDVCTLHEVHISPGQRVAVDTGLAFEIPAGHELQVRPRSGLAAKYGITIINTPGTVDEDYRGEIKIVLINLGLGRETLMPGERIAQLVLAPVVRAELECVEALSETTRGANGFGSTGRN